MAEKRDLNVNVVLMAVGNFLLVTALYMLYPVMPLWLTQSCECGSELSGVLTALFGLGILLMGPFYGYLVDRFARQSVCIWAVLGVAVSTLGFYFVHSVWIVGLMRLMQGALFGLSQMALGSCLVIDLSESKRRTEANTLFAWFGRFGLSVGPFVGIMLYNSIECGFSTIAWTSFGLVLVSALLVKMLNVPFRAPLNPPVCSLDRFWLPKAMPVIVNIIPVTVLVGIVLARYYRLMDVCVFGYMMVGFAISLTVRQRRAWCKMVDVQLISLIWLLALVLSIYFCQSNGMAIGEQPVVLAVSGVFAGTCFGLSLSTFLHQFILVADHCQRGTANNTFRVCCELGISLGFATGYLMISEEQSELSLIEVVLAVFAVALYVSRTRGWLKKNMRQRT